MIYFTSDLHFGHEAVIKYCHRPFENLDHMHAELIKRWNSKVHDQDLVYVLGDLALAPYNDTCTLIKQLKGKKILIRGNHDSYSFSQYSKLGFDLVYSELKLKLFGRNMRMSHYPYALPWFKRPFAFKSELRFMYRRPPRIAGEILLHGHTHTKYRATKDSRIHVGVDAWDYTPVSLRQIESLVARMK
jgi:calcineurin-like phosphoesterase family protein